MSPTATITEPSYSERLAALRRSKMQQTLEKQRIRGAMDFDDHAVILPPEELRETVQTLGGSGVYFTDVLLKSFRPIPNHPNGAFYGPRATGENFRRLLEVHPGAASIPCHPWPERTWQISCPTVQSRGIRTLTAPSFWPSTPSIRPSRPSAACSTCARTWRRD